MRVSGEAVMMCMYIYCISARAIRQILASSPRAIGQRVSANIMTYSPCMHAHSCTNFMTTTVPIYHTEIVVTAI